MKSVTQQIKSRRSVRSFDGSPLNKAVLRQIMTYAQSIQNPFHLPVTFKLLSAKEDGLSCPVVTGTDTYIGAKIKCVPYASIAFGYTFEALILYAQSLGIGTVWLGGTMNRSAFEQAMNLDKDEMMPCASPLGYAADKMSLRETMMRKAIKADERLPFEELFFDSSFSCPLTIEKAGVLYEALCMTRLAPSAVNKQPWRVILNEHGAHFYLKRSSGFSKEGKLDMQMIDMGIALCHFDLTAQQNHLNLKFIQNNPKLTSNPEFEYIGSFLTQ